MININSLRKAYYRLKEIYVDEDKKFMQNRKFRTKHNPVKQAFELAGTKACVLKSTNVMYASMPSGNIAKSISIDDVTGITRETVVYTDKNMNVTVLQDKGLTTLRCGIMAVLSADLNYQLTPLTKVGFIGNGNINQKTMEVLNLLFGIKQCVIRGSEKDRSKNKEKFEEITHGSVIVDDTASCSILNECEVIFCCTSSYKKEHMISSNQLNKPSLIVVQDGGYILDESFRSGFKRISCTDHEEQLYDHYRSEFPHDRRKRYFLTMSEDSASTCKKVVYLYGVAIADLIVFEEFFAGEKKC